MVLNSVANSETPIRMGFMFPLPVKYSCIDFVRRLKYSPRPIVDTA